MPIFFGEKMLKQSFVFLQTYDERKKLCETPEERRLFQTLDQRFMSDLESDGEDLLSRSLTWRSRECEDLLHVLKERQEDPLFRRSSSHPRKTRREGEPSDRQAPTQSLSGCQWATVTGAHRARMLAAARAPVRVRVHEDF